MEDLDFKAIFGQGTHAIVVPRVTLRELDKHKNTHASKRIRERAQKALKNIERWTRGAAVREGVSMELMVAVPTDGYAARGLNPLWADDVLIASVLQYMKEHPEVAPVALVTQDSAARMAASHFGVHVMELPDSLKLPNDLDPLEVENRDLLRRLSELENALPELRVSFHGTDRQHATFELTAPPASMEREIDQAIEDLGHQYPNQHPPQRDSESKELPASLQVAQGILSSIPADEFKRYNRDVAEFLRDYERYLRDTEELRARRLRTISFAIEICNTGTAPADDVDVLLHFPDGSSLFTEESLPVLPEEPLPPRNPRTSGQMMEEGLLRMTRFNLEPPTLPDFRLPSSFSIKRTKSYNVRDQFPRIKHGHTEVLPQMYLTFDTFESASSFACEFTIRPANLPRAITGQLHFVIEKL